MSTFNPLVPTGLVNLDVDYKALQLNFQQSDTSFGVDHYKFSDQTVNNGKHLQVQMPNLSAIPVVAVAGESVLYSKAVSGVSNLFFTPDNSANEYRLTTPVTASFATFATNTNYQVGPPSLNGGWTFLPGGLLLQYGDFLSNVSNPITFPVAFTTCFEVIGITSANDRAFAVTSISATSFNFSVLNPSALVTCRWFAIGVK